MIEANDPKLKSWVEVKKDSDFPIQNLPFGIFKTRYLTPVAGIAIGEHVLDLVYLHEHGYFHELDLPIGIFNQRYLNGFLELGRKAGTAVRNRVSELLRHDHEELKSSVQAREMALIPMAETQMLMPVQVPNYTDFYSSEEHATHVGTLFRDPKNALLPNWKHLPVGYHGRASSIVVSGTAIHRPKGQIKLPDADQPVFGPTRKLDYELELAFITCSNTQLGTSVSIGKTEEHIFGFVLFNDWSARDIQQWEYAPLGPFLGKNFGSIISPWIITLDALEPFRVAGPVQTPPVLPYLVINGDRNFDIQMEATLYSGNGKKFTLCRTNSKYLYWNINQQLAHQTVNGCNIEVGDMYASGTISGPGPESLGSLLELTRDGSAPIRLDDGTERSFIEDYDTVILHGHAVRNGIRIGFGECSSKILPARE